MTAARLRQIVFPNFCDLKDAAGWVMNGIKNFHLPNSPDYNVEEQFVNRNRIILRPIHIHGNNFATKLMNPVVKVINDLGEKADTVIGEVSGLNNRRISLESWQVLANRVIDGTLNPDLARDNPDPRVRFAVARCGERLEYLVEDDNPDVRAEVVRQAGYLFQSDNPEEQQKGLTLLQTLVNDKSPLVREKVARAGCKEITSTLINDKNNRVKEAVIDCGTIDDKRQMRKDPDWGIARKARKAYKKEQKQFANWVKYVEKLPVDEINTFIDIGKNDADARVRNVVAKLNAKQERIAPEHLHDEAPEVRATIAKNGTNLDEYVNDSSCIVRRTVAAFGRSEDLDKLVNDPIAAVRMEVVKHGREKDLLILINDKSKSVSEAASKKLKEIDRERRHSQNHDRS